jgi:hypothetical protein
MASYNDDSVNQLAEITTITNLINQLYKDLQDSLSTSNRAESDNIIKNINTLSSVRSILYNNYVQMNENAQETSISQKIAYDETMAAIEATNREIEESKKKIALLNQEKYNRLRLIEINNYYGSQYSNHQKIILYIIVLCSFFLITIILKNKNILSSNIYFWLNIIVISISIIIIGYMISDAYNRDNMMYDENNYNFDYNKTILNYPINPTTTTTTTTSTMNNSCGLTGSTYCSNNQTFNNTTQKCESNPVLPAPIDTSSVTGNLYIMSKNDNSQIII